MEHSNYGYGREHDTHHQVGIIAERYFRYVPRSSDERGADPHGLDVHELADAEPG